VRAVIASGAMASFAALVLLAARVGVEVHGGRGPRGQLAQLVSPLAFASLTLLA
jgi:hypothetical protein